MNTKSISKPIGNTVKGRSVAGRTILVQVLVAALLLAAVAVYSRVTAQQADPVISAVEASIASNPELKFARRYTAEHNPASSQAYLAANPELALARRFAAVKKPVEATLLEANHEQSFARHNGINQNLTITGFHSSTAAELRQAQLYVAHRWDGRISSYLAANPELILARRSGASQHQVGADTDLSSNPELLLARRFGKEMENKTRWEYLSANPELFIVHRYMPTLTKK